MRVASEVFVPIFKIRKSVEERRDALWMRKAGEERRP